MIRFDRFMEAALYHPERGYYTSRIKSVGSRGDFTTTPQLSKLLAKAIAQAFRDSGARHLIEVGPGTGQLAKDIWCEFPFLTKRKSQHHLVEVSPVLRKTQKEIASHTKAHKTIQSALASTHGEAFIYSNELVDAFPARIFRKEAEGWCELHLEGKQPRLTEQFLPIEKLPDSTLFAHDYPLHQRIEVHESYQQWLREWLPNFAAGQLLTIDYVAPQPRLRDGTLRGYFLQDRLTGANLYQNAGHIDLTADVHFDDLEKWGQERSLATLTRQSQREFFSPFATKSPADQYLLDPDGAGTAFQVLLQEKSRS